LDSGVMIRFLEHTPEGLVFKSGGGVTLQSDCQKEYDELCAKVYIPVH
jgi:para-aminobenzoate synthetase component I